MQCSWRTSLHNLTVKPPYGQLLRQQKSKTDQVSPVNKCKTGKSANRAWGLASPTGGHSTSLKGQGDQKRSKELGLPSPITTQALTLVYVPCPLLIPPSLYGL